VRYQTTGGYRPVRDEDRTANIGKKADLIEKDNTCVHQDNSDPSDEATEDREFKKRRRQAAEAAHRDRQSSEDVA